MSNEIDSLLDLPEVEAMIAHHQNVYGAVNIGGVDDGGVPVVVGARKIGSISGDAGDNELKALALSLNAILSQMVESRNIKIDLSKRMMMLVERLQKAEERLAGPMRRRSDDIERQSGQLAEAATTDPLTGVLNRRGLEIRLNKAVGAAIADSTPITVLMIDVDHFKSVNDDYGHLVGDKVLALLGETLSKGRRSEDLIGRWGGEEFLAVLPDCSVEDGNHIAESIRGAIEALAIETEKGELRITASIGVCGAHIAMDDVVSMEQCVLDIVSTADERLYAAKESGRNCVVSK